MGREFEKIAQVGLGFVGEGSGSPKNAPNNSKYVLKFKNRKNPGKSENLVFPIFPLGATLFFRLGPPYFCLSERPWGISL